MNPVTIYERKMLLLIKINAGSVPGDLQHQCGTTNQSSAVYEDGHEAREHDNDLEHIGPDHSFDSTL